METTLKNVRLLRQEQILKEWWPEVKENFWDSNIKAKTKELLKALMQQTLIEDMELQRQQRTELVYRNGYYPRTLVTEFGMIDGLRISASAPRIVR